MNKYIRLINKMYNNNIRLHTPLQNIDSGMPTALLEILSVSDGIEEVISVGDRKESIGWILYSYEMIKNNTGYYTAEYGINGYIFSDDGAGNVFVMKDNEFDGAWIEALKGNMSEEDRQFHIQAFIEDYEVK